MAYRFHPAETLPESAVRVHREQIEQALKDIAKADKDPDEAVHEVRKRLKKLRGLARLLRFVMPDEYSDLNARYRNLGRELSALRDARAKLEALDELEQRVESDIDPAVFEPVRSRLEVDHHTQTQDGEAITAALEQTAADLEAALDTAEYWDFRKPDDAEALMQGLKQTYSRARKAYRNCYQGNATGADFHEWRKRTKYLWYEIRLLQNCWPQPLKAWRKELKHLSSILGDEHDLTVIRATVQDNIDRFEDPEILHPFVGVLDGWQTELRLAADQVGARLFTEKPKAFARRFRRYWETWEEEKTQDVSEQATVELIA